MAKKHQAQAFGSQKSYCTMLNQGNADETVLYLYDEIGGWGIWADEFVAMLNRITTSVIRIRVHCDGGWVGDAIAMHASVLKHPAKVIMEVDSLAASAASFFIQAGDERVMAENAQLMIHDVQGAVKGTEAQIRAYADYVAKTRESILLTYAYRTTISIDEARAMMTKGTDVYLSAQEALDMGFIDRIETLAEMSAAKPDIQDPALPNPQSNHGMNNHLIDEAMRDLNRIYQLPSNQHTPEKKGETMNKSELIAQLKSHDIDVVALQTENSALAQNLSLSKTAQSTAEASLAAASSMIDAGKAYTSNMVDSLIQSRRTLKTLGDTAEEVKNARTFIESWPLAHIEAEAKAMGDLCKNPSNTSFSAEATDDPEAGGETATFVEKGA